MFAFVFVVFPVFLSVFVVCQLKRDLIGGEQPAGPDDGEAGGRAGLHHRQHGEHHKHLKQEDDDGRKMLLMLAEEVILS